MSRRIFIVALLACLLVVGAVSAQDAHPTCEPGFRLFTHELLWSGTPDGVCIPEKPQRVAYSWVFHIPALLRANYPFAGIGSQDYVISQFPEWEPVIRAIPQVALPPNLEATLAVDPDVIIEPSWAAEENYTTLSEIAPVVAFTFDGTHQWKQLAEMYFEIAGIPEGYDTLMAEYETRAQELGALIGDPQDTEVSLVWMTADNPNLDTNYSVGGTILKDVGFALTPAATLEGTPEEIIAADGIPFYTALSWEEVPQVDADYIIVYGDFTGEEGEKLVADTQANPLWQSLSAVQSGNVYYSSANWAGGDIAAAHNLLDDLAQAFGVADQFSANPYKTLPESVMQAYSE